MAKAIKTLLETSCHQLSNSHSPRLDAELLLQFTLNCDRSYLYSHSDQCLNEQHLARFETLLKQRQQGWPVAYLTGQREFWSMPLTVTTDTLIPRPETETLVEVALNFIPQHQPFKLLDLGTGSGAISLALARERPQAHIIATDKFDKTLEVAKQNAKQLELKNIEFIHSDWYQNLSGKDFDMIVSNPPYIAKDDPHSQDINMQYEPRDALLANNHGLADIDHIIKNSHQYLTAGGLLILEHGWQQGSTVIQLMQQNHFSSTKGYNDLQNIHRITLGKL